MQSIKGTFVVTLSFAHRAQLLRPSFKVPERSDPLFQSIDRNFVLLLQRVLPRNLKLLVVPLTDLESLIKDKIDTVISRQKVIVNTSPCLAGIFGGSLLQVNRLFDPQGEFLGYGNRPGSKPMYQQIADIALVARGKSIILVEDGVFSGGTLRFVMNLFENVGLSVSDIIVGFCKLSAEEALRSGFNGRFKIVLPIDTLIDWLPLHDVLCPVPFSGRVLGIRSGHSFVPFTVRNQTYSSPYIAPYGHMREWVGIDGDAAREISRFGLYSSRAFFSALEVLNQKTIYFGDLVACSGVSLPMISGVIQNPPALSLRVVDYLSDIEKTLAV